MKKAETSFFWESDLPDVIVMLIVFGLLSVLFN